MSDPTSWTLNGKDLIQIGIFSAIYFALSFLGMLMGMIPILWILMPGIVAILAGVPFMLLCSRVQKPGVAIWMGLITGLLYYATGQFTVVILTTFAIGCLLAEIVRWMTKYRRFWGNAIAFVLFSYGMTGSPLPVWLFRDHFFAQIAAKGIPSAYIETLQSLTSPTMLVVLLVAPIIGGLIGVAIAKSMFRKHFTKAGML